MFNVKLRPWTRREERLLGKRRDEELAVQFGRTVQAVTAHRNVLGIPAYDSKVCEWTKSEIRLLGTMPDRELARRINRTARAVKFQRVDRKIRSFR